jgi:hypothetical protein
MNIYRAISLSVAIVNCMLLVVGIILLYASKKKRIDAARMAGFLSTFCLKIVIVFPILLAALAVLAFHYKVF